MGFKVQTSPTFWRKVKLVQTAEEGRIVEGEINVQFKRQKKDQIQLLSETVAGRAVLPEHVLPLMKDWKDYDNGNGATPFSREALEELSQDVPGAPASILTS